MKLKHIFLIFIFSTILQAKAQQPNILPQFTFYKLDGKAFSNRDIKQNKKSLFILFDCTCEHCQRETKLLNINYNKFKNVNIYMVTLDESFAIQQFFGSYASGLNLKPNVTVLQDKKQMFIPTFFPNKYPAMYLYAPNGKLLVYNSGDGGVKKVLKAIGK